MNECLGKENHQIRVKPFEFPAWKLKNLQQHHRQDRPKDLHMIDTVSKVKNNFHHLKIRRHWSKPRSWVWKIVICLDPRLGDEELLSTLVYRVDLTLLNSCLNLHLCNKIRTTTNINLQDSRVLTILLMLSLERNEGNSLFLCVLKLEIKENKESCLLFPNIPEWERNEC